MFQELTPRCYGLGASPRWPQSCALDLKRSPRAGALAVTRCSGAGWVPGPRDRREVAPAGNLPRLIKYLFIRWTAAVDSKPSVGLQLLTIMEGAMRTHHHPWRPHMDCEPLLNPFAPVTHHSPIFD